MAPHAGERQDVGLDTGAAGGVRCGEGEDDRREIGLGLGGHGSAASAAPGARRRMGLIEFDFTPSTSRRMKKYMCLICGWIYDEAAGAPDEGIAPGTKWEDVPPNWTCPECGARKEDFEM